MLVWGFIARYKAVLHFQREICNISQTRSVKSSIFYKISAILETGLFMDCRVKKARIVKLLSQMNDLHF